MKRISGLLALMCVSELAFAGGNVVGSVGMRSLNTNAFPGMREQLALGVLADIQLGSTPIHAAVGLQVSADESRNIEVSVTDFSAGLKLMPTQGLFRPYLGAGIVSVRKVVENDWSGYDSHDQSFGYYAGGGVLFRVSSHVNVGFDLRWIGGTEMELNWANSDADSFVGSVVVGYGWGK